MTLGLPPVNWQQMLVPSVSLLELIVRGTVIYLLIVAAFRVFRRPAGGLSMTDLVVIVLVADAAQNAMASEYRSITEGLVLVLTIVTWNWLLDWMGFHNRWIYRLLHPTPALLVKDGQIQRRNLRAELLTRDELDEFLREQGIDDLRKVKSCFLEPDGQLSVIRAESESSPPHRPRREVAR